MFVAVTEKLGQAPVIGSANKLVYEEVLSLLGVTELCEVQYD